MKRFFIVCVIIATFVAGMFIGVLFENVKHVKDIEPHTYYVSVERTSPYDFSRHEKIIDINKFIDSYKTSLYTFTADKITENGDEVYADLGWYRSVAEQLEMWSIYDNANAIIHSFEDGKTATELEIIIINAANALQEE